MLSVAIFVTRPKKSLQPVSFGSGNDVYMQMRHALTHAIIDRNESPLRSQSCFHCHSQQSRVRRQPLQKSGSNFIQRLHVLFRYQQAVAREQWSVIKEGES